MSWSTWDDERWLSEPPPAKPPECADWTDTQWRDRVEFQRRQARQARGERARLSSAVARNETRSGDAAAWRAANGMGPITLEDLERENRERRDRINQVPVDLRAAIIADAKRREDERKTKDAALDARIRREIEEDLARREEDARQAAIDASIRARGGLPRIVPTPEPELRASTVKVGDEPLVYGPGSSFSWIRDMFAVRTASMGTAIPSRERGMGPSDVADRLQRNDRQMAHLARTTESARVLYRNYFQERNRPYHGTVSDHGDEQFRDFAVGEFRAALSPEARAASTLSASMGDFAPPIFLLEDWQKYRTVAAPAAARAASRDLPPTGMEVTIPAFTASVAMAVQTTQNTAIASSTPTVAFRQAAVLTIGGKVSLSQQLLDRAGPGVGADQVIAEQSAREAATTLDSEVLTKIIAGLPTSHKISNSGTAGVPALWADVAKASSLTTTVEGTRLPLDTVLMPPLNGAWFRAQLDKQTRPIWTPSAAGIAARTGTPDSQLEGYTGYDLQGSLVFEDANLAPTTTHATLIAGNFGRGVLVMTGVPIVNVWPEFDPATLTALLTVRQYVAIGLLYPSAFVQISGSAYAKTPSFTGS